MFWLERMQTDKLIIKATSENVKCYEESKTQDEVLRNDNILVRWPGKACLRR